MYKPVLNMASCLFYDLSTRGLNAQLPSPGIYFFMTKGYLLKLKECFNFNYQINKGNEENNSLSTKNIPLLFN